MNLDLGKLDDRHRSVKEYKRRWSSWLYKNTSQVNIMFTISNVLYTAVALAALVLTLLVMHEHVEDFKRNEFTQHSDGLGGRKMYPPCGMPTPDSMYLLQALGAVEAGGFGGASLEPNYQAWMKKVDRALCRAIVPGQPLPMYFAEYAAPLDGAPANEFCNLKLDATGNIPTLPGGLEVLFTDYGIDHAEELIALAYLIGDDTIRPLGPTITPADVVEKTALFEKKACLEDDDGDGNAAFYNKQQREAYGDLKTRVARAYIAAMPAFSRYSQERKDCQKGELFNDPFDDRCKHSCHVRHELEEAANDQFLMYDSQVAIPATMPVRTTFTKQLYRLLALSLAGYHDRYHNRGACFRNSEVDSEGNAESALKFCENSMKTNTEKNSEDSITGTAAMAAYASQNSRIEESEQCKDPSYSPPSAAPTIDRNNKLLESGRADHVCALTLQYGLFEQGRLFGIPDVIHPFVVDNRVDRGIHFIAEYIYTKMYVEPMENAGTILQDPKSKLELYIAYRLSSTSIWAILVANVAGFMLVRAVLPLGITILSLLGVTTVNLESVSADGVKVYEPIKLVRPQVGGVIYMVLFVNLLIIYWIFWLDPATQSHYYISTTCEDWQGLGVHVPSGVFGSSWGKTRYERYGEHVAGWMMILLLIFTIAQRVFGVKFVPTELLKEDNKVKEGETARLDCVAYIMVGFGLAVQGLFIAQSIVSGHLWYESVTASDSEREDVDIFAKDVLMSVWAAFWTSTAIAWYRQKWAIDKLPRVYQYAWMAACILTLWMPVFQSDVLLEKQIDAAFQDGKGTTDVVRQIIYIAIYAVSGIWTGLLLWRLSAVVAAIPDNRANDAHNTANEVEGEKDEIKAKVKEVEEFNEAQQEIVDAPMMQAGTIKSAVRFDLSRLHLGPALVPMLPSGKPGAVYMPLLPAK